MIKIKSISKRVLAVILATLMLLTSGIVGTLAANVDFAETGAYKELAETGASIPAGSGNLIVFNNTLGWSAVHLYTRSTDLWNGNNGCTTSSATHYTMTRLSGTNYWYAYMTTSYKYVLFMKDQQDGYGNIWQTQASYRSDYSTAKQVFTPSTTSSQTTNSTTYYSNGNWSVYEAPEVDDTEKLVVFNNTLGWNNVYLYTSSSNLWNGNNGCTTNGATRYDMERVPGTNYWIAYVTVTDEILFMKDKQDNYGNIWQTQASYRTDYSSAAPMFTPSTTSNQTTNSTTYYSTGTWSTYTPGYTYTVSAGEGGSVTPSGSGTGTSVAITATANTGYTFAGWTCENGSVDANTASTTFRPTANNATAVASFTKNNYTLTVNQTGDAIGTVTVNGNQFTKNTGTHDFPYNTSLIYYVSAPDNYVIDTLKVDGAVISGASGLKNYNNSGSGIPITEDFAIDVSYKKVAYTVTYNVNGTETTESVKHEEKPVSVPSTDRTGYTFLGWSTSSDGSSGYVTVTDEIITGNVTYYAVYQINTYTVTFMANGEEFDTQQVPYGSKATAPDTSEIPTPEGKEFNGWDKDINTTITGDTTFIAQYVDKQYAFALTVIPTDGTGGTVNNPYGNKVTHGQTITLTATPNTANLYEFGGWNVTGECVVVEDGTTVTISKIASAITVEAIFQMKDTGIVNATTVDSAMGTVSPSTSTVALETPVKVTATAKTGYKFSSWNVTSAGTVGTDYTVSENGAEITITPKKDGVVVSVEAVFVGVTGTVNFVAGEGGSVDKPTATVTYPNKATATATATAEGVQFAGWTVTAVKSDGTNASKGTDYNYNSLSNETIEVTVITDGVTVTATASFSSGYSIDAYYLSANNFTDIDILEYKDASTSNTVYTGAAQGTEKFGDVTWNSAGTVDFKAGYTHSVTAQMYKGSGSGDGSVNIYVDFTEGLTNWNSGQKGDGKYYLAITGSGNANYPVNAGNTSYVVRNNNGTYYLPSRDTWLNTEGKHVSGNIYVWNIPAEYVSDLQNYGFTISSKHLGSSDSFWQTNASHVAYNASYDLYKLTSARSYVTDRESYIFTLTTKSNMPSTSDPYEIVNDLYPNGVWCDEDAVWIYDTGSDVIVTFRTALDKELADKKYKTAYDAGIANSNEYSSGWTDSDNDKTNDFKSAYENAKAVLGNGASTQQQINDALTALKNTYGKLVQNQSVNVYLSHGMIKDKTSAYYGTSSFVSGADNIGSTTGNISDTNVDVVTGVVQRNQTVIVQTKVKDSSYYVKGYVINGTRFEPATVNPDNEDIFQAPIIFTESSNVVPVYFKDGVDESNDNVITLFAQIGDFEEWTDYIGAYVWYESGGYVQFGDWTGQLMIPDNSNDKGMYYTYVEKTDANGNEISGITFLNYGNNQHINSSMRYQTYDYHEFLALQDYDNITFVLKESDYNCSYLGTSDTNSTTVKNHNSYEVFTNIDGQPTDIYGEVLTGEISKTDDALYIIRKGHVEAGEEAGIGFIGTRTENEDGTTSLTVAANSFTGHYYVDCYLYDGTGDYIGRVKSYELEDLEVLAHQDGRRIDLSRFKGKPVFVDYESRTGNHGGGGEEHLAYRYDGEWFAYNNEDANFTVEVVSALDTGDGKYEFAEKDADGLMNKADWGNTSVTAGETTSGLVTVSQGAEFDVTASKEVGYNFVGWYYGEKDEDGNVTIKDLYKSETFFTGNASASVVYVAVYKEHVEGSIYIRNFAYHPMENVDENKGQSLSQYAPKAYGEGNLNYSTRYVQVTILDENGNTIVERPETLGNADGYQDYIEQVETGQTLRITMFTKPTISTDYVYAWYKQTFDDAEGKIVNYEEVAPKEGPFTEADKGQLKQFTFDYVVGTEIPEHITIYSDVVHQSENVTITYKYNNRYGDLVSYTIPYKLEGDEFKNKRPSYLNIKKNAPYVDDLYKKVSWEFEDNDVNQEASDFYVYAYENGEFTINLYAKGESLTKTVPFNTAIDIYAYDINKECTNRAGVWYLDADDDGNYDSSKGDKLLNYGNYFGLVVTDDMTVCYTDEAELIYEIILGEPIYGREQTTNSSGNNAMDTIYVDYILSYMIPHFTGDKIDVMGTPDNLNDDVVLRDDVNYNTPVQIKTLEEAGLLVDYGVVLEQVNTKGPDDARNNFYETYYGKNTLDDNVAEFNGNKAKLDEIIRQKEEGKDVRGAGDNYNETGALATYFYVYETTNATNKNRVLKTFAFDNTPQYQNLYYNVYGYMKITYKDGTCDIIYSNPQTLNILDESIENAAN